MTELSQTATTERWVKPLFVTTIVTGSFLLFLTQPMIARMALPRLGGAPAVWNSAMLVYQALLLGGYAYAHWVSRLAPRPQAGLHLVLFAVAALWLPIGLRDMMPSATASPAWWVPWFLVSSIGPLFLMISSQAPLMQRWFAMEGGRGEPYALYAASNIGSFAGLFAYPLIVEPMLTLDQQSVLWTGGYALLVLLVALCAYTMRGAAVERAQAPTSEAPSWRRIGYWIALAAVPSGLMLSTTTHLTTDIVAMPLLWAIPLGLYLLSFSIAFADARRLADLNERIAPLVILVAGGIALADTSDYAVIYAGISLLLLFVVAVALHSELYRLRPAPDRLTAFYLVMAFGGMLGGVLCAIVAPMIFDWVYEHPLLIIGAAILVPQSRHFPLFEQLHEGRTGRIMAMLVAAILLASLLGDKRMTPGLPDWAYVATSVVIGTIALLCIGRRWLFGIALAAAMLAYGGWSQIKDSAAGIRTRSYFGIYRVADYPQERSLSHGTTLHGLQLKGAGREKIPTTYYVANSGVGLAMRTAEIIYGKDAAIGVIGLGTGTLACYHQPGQSWTYFEIDPAMVEIARNRFSFLKGCAPDARIVLGDARLMIGREPARSMDLLAVDAFSSDAVPMHLLTREALADYARVLRPDGLLLMHISNRYLELEPVLAATARADRWHARMLRFSPSATETANESANASVWVAMSKNPEALAMLMLASGRYNDWKAVPARRDFAPWTDNYSSILPLLKLPL